MSEQEQQSEDVAMWNIRRVLVNAAPPKVAHFFSWTHVGDQILLEVGYFDLVAVQKRMESKEASIDWLVTDRYILDLESGERLVDAITALGQNIVKTRASGDANANAT